MKLFERFKNRVDFTKLCSVQDNLVIQSIGVFWVNNCFKIFP